MTTEYDIPFIYAGSDTPKIVTKKLQKVEEKLYDLSYNHKVRPTGSKRGKR